MPSAVAQSQGATGAAVNTVGSDILPQSGQLWDTGSANLTSFSDYLKQLTSGNPALVSQSAGPQIANVTQQGQNAADQIATLPRGGEREYLQAQNAQTTSSDISQLLNQIITQAHQQQGQLGEFGTGTSLAATEAGAGIELGAGQNFLQQAGVNNAASGGIASTIGDILSTMIEAGATAV